MHSWPPPSPLCSLDSAKPGNQAPARALTPSPDQSWLVQLPTLAQWGLGIRTLTLKKARHPTPFLCSSLTS